MTLEFQDIKQVTLIKAYDWQALYLNGECVDQNHSLNCNDLFRHVKHFTIRFEVITATDNIENQVMENGVFPKKYLDLKW